MTMIIYVQWVCALGGPPAKQPPCRFPLLMQASLPGFLPFCGRRSNGQALLAFPLRNESGMSNSFQ